MEKEHLNEQIFKMSLLIFQEMTGNLSIEGRHQLECWRKECAKNERLYIQWKNRIGLVKKLHQIQEVEITRPLKEMYMRIAAAEKRKKRQRWQWTISAAAVITLFIGGFYVLQMSGQRTSVTAKQQTIAAGSAKAILRLSDGQVVALDTLTQQLKQGNAEIAKTDGRKLSYIVRQKAVKDSEKIVYNEIEVPRGGEFDLMLSDSSAIWLNAGSKLRYPVTFTGKERKVFLEGEAYFKVKKQTEIPFFVEVRGQTVEVLGTEFNVTGYTDEEKVYTTLVIGKVKVATQTEEISLAPGEQCVSHYRDGRLNKQKVDVKKIVGWKNGMFILEEQTLEQIMQKFARWYDITVCYRNEDVRQIVFKGMIPRHTELQKVLKVLEKTNEVKFNIQNRTVMVYK